MTTSPAIFRSKRGQYDESGLKLQWAIREERIIKWMQGADLARITGQAGVYLPALQHAGIESVRQLAESSPSTLIAAVRSYHQRDNSAILLPDESQICHWIELAKSMVATDSCSHRDR